MRARQPTVPTVWLVTDARNDAVLERVMARLPRGSGVIFRHYHLAGVDRAARFRVVAANARRHGHSVVLSGPMTGARAWGATGAYGSPAMLAPGPAGLRLVTAHGLREIAAACRARADAIVLSPVFSTRSHPGGTSLGPVRFRLLARRAGLPFIALGGMDKRRARRLGNARWAAIDGLLPN
jgi:thiamine-phosphate pyrophosphorylase